jgi:hypothetical protein
MQHLLKVFLSGISILTSRATSSLYLTVSGFKPPERLHRVHTRMNIDDGDDPKVRRKSFKMEMWAKNNLIISR